MEISTKIAALRVVMKAKNLAAYLIPSSDPHQSEYVAPHWESRKWLSDFTGSAGVLVVTMDHAGLWTDSRYFIQAEQELADTPIQLHRLGPARGPEYIEWLGAQLPSGSILGMDGMLCSLNQNRNIVKILHRHGLEFENNHDLIREIWTDRPSIPTADIFALPSSFSGLDRDQKFTQIREAMAKRGADHYLLSALDEIAWTFNLRGRDVEFNPVFIAYAIISRDKVFLFTDVQKIAKNVKEALHEDGVILKNYMAITDFLATLPAKTNLLIDKNTTSIGLYQKIEKANIITSTSIVQHLKGRKNETEIKHIRQAMRYDGVALTRLYRWLEEKLTTATPVTEAELADQLAAFRAEQPGYYGESFPAIVGYQANGAIVHYRPEHGSSATIQPNGLLLLDSGGQYESGTTDITRTTALGAITDDQRLHYTLVLKGHLGVALLHYPAGTKGYQIDTLARQDLWKAHLDYGHGTGHGVGFFLNVHEGPQSISSAAGRGGVPLEVGMLTSNEPGFYLPDAYGIRIENLVLTVEAGESAFGTFLKFDTVTLFPIDLSLVKKELLNAAEINWLNDYHEKVFAELSPLLNPEETNWLKNKCKPMVDQEY